MCIDTTNAEQINIDSSTSCPADKEGNHHTINNETMRVIYKDIERNMKEGTVEPGQRLQEYCTRSS